MKTTPTTPPTETVSECCGAETLFHDSLSMDKRHYTCTKCHQVCGNIAPTRPTTILTKEMIERAAKYSNEKQAELVEPTVDKWEEDYKKLFIDIWLSSTTIGVEEGDRLLSFIRTIIAHSVQEAKAEESMNHPTTVSACCGAEVETRYSSFIDGNQYTCTKCRLVNCDVVERPTPTTPPTKSVSVCQNCENVAPNRAISVDKDGKCIFCHRQVSTPNPPTETVSECTCRPELHKSLHEIIEAEKTCPIHSPTETTVMPTKEMIERAAKYSNEKQAELVEPTVDKWEESLILWITECQKAESTKPLANHINTLLTKSVQEAKAEERNLWLVVIQSALFYGTNLKTLRNHLKGMLQDFPSDKETPRYTKLLPIKRRRNAKQTK